MAARHRVCRIGALTVVALLLAVVAWSAKPKPEVQKLRVGYLPIAECAHLYVGLSKGYFQAEGLDLELIPRKGGAVILPDLQHGDLDVGFTNVVSLISVDAHLQQENDRYIWSLIGATYERSPTATNHALLVRRNSTIKPADLGLTSTRIGVNTTRNIEELILRRYLRNHGVNATTLNLISIPFPEMLPALESGSIDVAAVVEPFIEPALRTGKFRLLSKHYQDRATETLVATYAVSTKWQRENPDAARRFKAAFRAADRFIREHPTDTRKAIGQYTSISDRDLAVMGMPAFAERLSEVRLNEIAELMKTYRFIDSSAVVRPMLAGQ